MKLKGWLAGLLLLISRPLEAGTLSDLPNIPVGHENLIEVCTVFEPIVYFGYGKHELSPNARALLDRVALELIHNSWITFVIRGHTDRVGSSAYNFELSRKRAQAVSDYLVEQGAPVGWISVVWFGEDEPMVPTEDGTREPNNRRVEIWPNGVKPSCGEMF